jgi:hypothetical protein
MLLNGQNLKCCSIWQAVFAVFIAHLFHILNTCYGLSNDDVNVSIFSASICKFICVYMLQFHKL